MILRRTIRSRLGRTRPVSYDWYRTAEALYDYWRRDMSDSLRERERLYPVNGSQHVPRFVPWIWAVAREMATAYMQPPARSWTTPTGEPLDEAVTSMLSAAYRRLGVNRVMLQADRHLEAVNNSTIWVYPHEDGTQRLVLMPIHDQDVETDTPFAQEEDDATAWRFMVPIPIPETLGSYRWAVAYVSKTEAYWEDAPGGLSGKGLYSRGDDRSNPYGTIPVVLMRGSLPAPGEWWGPLATDKLQAQRAINHDLTDVGHIARMQGFGQPYVKGMTASDAKELQLGPETALGIPDAEGEFGFATAQPKLAETVEVLKEYVSQVVAMNGTNPASFMKSSGITAVAKQIELVDRATYRRERIEVLQRAEQRLYDVLRAVVNAERGAEVWPEALVSVEYREPVIPADPLHHAQALERMLAMGQTGRVRARAIAEGVSLDEAARRMREDAELDASLQVSGASGTASQPSLDAPETALPTEPTEGGAVADTALNGAQMASIQAIIDAVNAGTMAPSTARAVINLAVPGREAAVERIIATLSARPAVLPTPDEAVS